MLKALVIKELRESAGIIALAALAAVFALTGMAGLPLLPIVTGQDPFPFVSTTFVFFMGWIVGVLAMAMGLKQSAWESAHNTYYFLLHRPASRKLVFGTKLVIGLTTVLGIGAFMILIYAVWAAGPGHTGVPFFWSMTLPAWQLLVSLTLVYLGAFLSGIRPARWFGSRLGPLIAAGFTVYLLAGIWSEAWLTFVLVAVCAAIGLAAIFQYVNSRDY
jgi:hypothetical protein